MVLLELMLDGMADGADMKLIKIKSEYKNYSDYEDDIKKIKNALKNAGYFATREQCITLWEMYSETYAAGWLGLPESDNLIVGSILRFFEEISPDDEEF